MHPFSETENPGARPGPLFNKLSMLQPADGIACREVVFDREFEKLEKREQGRNMYRILECC